MRIETIQNGYIIVSPKGNDSTARRDCWHQPFATLRKAFLQARNNDTILIYGAPNHEYQETPRDTLEENKQVWELPMYGAPFWLNQLQNVTVRGVGWPVVRFLKHGNGFNIQGCQHITMTGIVFAGQGYITEKGKQRYYALVLFNGINDQHLIEDNVFMDSGDHMLAHLYGPRSIFNTRVVGNKFYRNGNLSIGEPWHDGVAIGLGGYGNTITGNYGEHNNRFIEIESGAFGDADATAPAKRILVTDNICYHPWWQAIIITPMHGKQELYTQMIVRGNHVEGWGGPSPMPGGGTWGQMGFWLTGGKHVIFAENFVSDTYDGCGFQIESANCDLSHVQVLNNQCLRTGRTGIHLVVADNVTQWKDAPNPPTTNFRTHHCQIRGNLVKDSKGVGIWMGGEYNQVDQNIIDNSAYEGLYHENGNFNGFRLNSMTDCGGAVWPDGRMSGPTRILTALNTTDLHNDVFWVKKGAFPQPK